MGTVAVLMVLWPWAVISLTLLMLVAVISAPLVFGYDTFWKGVSGMLHKLARRKPERAAMLQKRLDRFAMRWDAVLDRFPEGMVDAFYLPDFGRLVTTDCHSEDVRTPRPNGL